MEKIIRPKVKNFDLKPYGYIVALTEYANKLENLLKSQSKIKTK